MLMDLVQTVDESDTHSETSHGTVPIETKGVVSLDPNLLPKTVITEAATTGWSRDVLEDTSDEMTELGIDLVYENANVAAEARPKRVTEELSCMPTPYGAVHNMWLSDDHSEAKQSVAPILELKLLLLKVPKL
jgi:hypothetical protein